MSALEIALAEHNNEQRRRYIERYPEYCPTHYWPQDRCRGCRLVVKQVVCPECGAAIGEACFRSDRTWGRVELERPHESRIQAPRFA